MANIAVVHVEEDTSQLAREVVCLGDLFRCSTALDVIVGAAIQAGHHLILFRVIGHKAQIKAHRRQLHPHKGREVLLTVFLLRQRRMCFCEGCSWSVVVQTLVQNSTDRSADRFRLVWSGT